MARHAYAQLQQVIGYRFREPKLLKQALTHSSYANEHGAGHMGSNERLEFLGDAVLELISSEYLYAAFPEYPEGKMTRLRASLVCEPTLAQCARAFSLQAYLLLGRGEEQTGGRERDSIISDALEAVIGGIYLDGGFANAKEFVHRFILTDIEHKKLFYDSKTILQETVQAQPGDDVIRYDLVDERGPDHAKIFVVDVIVDGKVLGRGQGSTKKSAEQKAAYEALMLLKGQGVCI